MPISDTGAASTRELAAIMFSDIVGYTAIMGRDEGEGLRAVREHRAHLHAVLPRFNGRLIGEIGDGTLSSFHSAVDAVNCASELQATLVENPDLRLRIGIHVGDVVFTDNTVLGDGVNIAARLNAIAAPGEVCISERVYDDIRNKPALQVRDLGEKRLKNVSRPIHVYQVFASDLVAHTAKLRRQGPRRGVIAGAAAALLAALAIMLFVRSRLSTPTPVAQQPSPPRVIRSIAVLPLDNFSGDPNQEYFSDGLTDELTTDLATISELRVISRGSVMQFKGAHRPSTPQIAKALNVDAVVEGSVVRVGDKVRVSAQLIDATDDEHLWAKSYERDSKDVLAMQDEIAEAIAKEVNVQLTPKEQARFGNVHPVNPAAHDAYLKGRYFLTSYTEERVRKAIEQFQQAIKIDPNFALPYTGLADAYTYGEDWYFPPTEVMPQAKAAAEKALQLDDTLAEAHASLAFINWEYDFDWTGSEREFRRAIELDPNYAFAHDEYGYLLTWLGRLDEADAEMRRASELDPLSAGITFDVGIPLAYQAKFDAAREQFRKALELDPNFFLPQWGLGWADLEAGKFNDAMVELQKATAMDAPPFVLGFLGYAYAKSGDRAKAQAALAELNKMASRRYVSPFCPALIYLGLGDQPRALKGLEKSYQVRSQWIALLKVDNIFDPLRRQPRFIELMKKVGLDK